jgi:hypothetical protein
MERNVMTAKAEVVAAPARNGDEVDNFIQENMWDSDSGSMGGCLCGNWLDFDFSVEQGSMAIESAPTQSNDEIQFEARSTHLTVTDSMAVIESESEKNANHLHYTFGDLGMGNVGVKVVYSDDKNDDVEFTIVYNRAIEYVETNNEPGFQKGDNTIGAHQFMAPDFIFRQVWPHFPTMHEYGADLLFFEGTDGTLTTATAVTAGANTQQYLMNGRLGCPHNTKTDFILDYMPENMESMFALQLSIYSKTSIMYDAGMVGGTMTGSGNYGGIIETKLTSDTTGYFGWVLQGYANGIKSQTVDVVSESVDCMEQWSGKDCSSVIFSFTGKKYAQKITWDPEIGVHGSSVDYSSASTVAASIVSVAAVVAAAHLV